MWYGMEWCMKWSVEWDVTNYTTCFATSYHHILHITAAQLYDTATLPVESYAICGGAMWWDGAWCGLWCNEQHATCGAQFYITATLHHVQCGAVEWDVVSNMWDVVWCVFVIWNCACGMLCCARCVMWNVRCGVTAPWFATSEKWCDVSCFSDVEWMWGGMECVAMWCGMWLWCTICSPMWNVLPLCDVECVVMQLWWCVMQNVLWCVTCNVVQCRMWDYMELVCSVLV